jgi:hypothetical protein
MSGHLQEMMIWRILLILFRRRNKSNQSIKAKYK